MELLFWVGGEIYKGKYLVCLQSLSKSTKTEKNIFLITEGACKKDEVTQVKPYSSALVGACRVVNRKFTNLLCYAIDINRKTSVDDIIHELTIIKSKRNYLTVLREGKRYKEELNLYQIKKKQSDDIKIREDGVYLITGDIYSTKNICTLCE